MIIDFIFIRFQRNTSWNWTVINYCIIWSCPLCCRSRVRFPADTLRSLVYNYTVILVLGGKYSAMGGGNGQTSGSTVSNACVCSRLCRRQLYERPVRKLIFHFILSFFFNSLRYFFYFVFLNVYSNYFQHFKRLLLRPEGSIIGVTSADGWRVHTMKKIFWNCSIVRIVKRSCNDSRV